jgi:hypothetical protein
VKGKNLIVLAVALGLGMCGVVFAQPGECCTTCSCLTCAQTDFCDGLAGVDPALCTTDGVNDCCGTVASGGPELCGNFVQNYDDDCDNNVCVPVDGGLGFLMAGALGLGVVGIRRREKLTFACE